MPRSKTIEFEIADILKLLLISTDEDLISNVKLKLDDLHKISTLINEEIDNLTKGQRTDGSFDKEYFINFIHKYNLSFIRNGNYKSNYENLLYRLNIIKESLDQLEWESMSNQVWIDDMRKAFSNPKTENVEKLFPEWLRNIPGNKNEVLADELKKEFKEAIGLDIRYMVEALKKLEFLIIPSRKQNAFNDAMKVFFDRDIGSYQSIFDNKLEEDWRQVIIPD